MLIKVVISDLRQLFKVQHYCTRKYSFSSKMDISGLRTNYNCEKNVLMESDIIVKDPLEMFHNWFTEARNHPNVIEPNAMCLSTVSKDSIPSARFVLCKWYGKDGFYFYTHYTSRKGTELEENPNVALTFFWAPLSKSVRIQGKVKKLPMSYAHDYFNARPYESQIGALCSDQSKPIESRQALVNVAEELKSKFKEGEVPKPEFWGGYAVIPSSIEFWQGQTTRLHDRIRFRKLKEGEEVNNRLVHPAENDWVYERLQP